MPIFSVVMPLVVILVEVHSIRQHWQFPKFTLNTDEKSTQPDDSEKLSALWYEQAVSGLLATVGTRLQRQVSSESPLSLKLEQCVSKVENSIQYAKCLAPLIRYKRLKDQLRKSRDYRKKTADSRRQYRQRRTASNNELFHYNSSKTQYSFFDRSGWPASIPLAPTPTTEAPLLVEIADWLTDTVRFAKEKFKPVPSQKIIFQFNNRSQLDRHFQKHYESKEDLEFRDEAFFDDSPVETFVKRTFAPALFGNSTGPDAWSSKPLTRQALLSNVTRALDIFLHNHGYSNRPNAPNANEIVPTWQIDFLEDVHQLITQMTQQAQTKAQQLEQQQLQQKSQPKHAVKLLSPRLLPLDADDNQYDAKLLSPDILSFNDQGIASIPQMLGATVGEQSKEAWLRFIMEASGVKDLLGGDQKLFDTILKAGEGNENYQENLDEFSKVFDETTKKFESTFKQLYKTFTMDQITRMEQRGYAYMSRDQIEYIYQGPESPCAAHDNCSIDFNLDHYEKMNDHQRDDALLDFILELAEVKEFHNEANENHGGRRQKRTLLLTPVKFSPIIKMPQAVSMPIILSPVLFSPVILSPSLLGPIILSPALFSPVILNPFVLGTLLLSPFVATPVILSPLVLFPLILSPLVLSPFILVPYLLTPAILTPLVLSPAILTPNALSPLILDPGVLNPLILAPHVLSPIILSPQVLGALILSPGALSPIIASPVALFAVILSPQVLG